MASPVIDKALVDAFHEAHRELLKQIKDPAFVSQRENFDFLTLEVIDRSDVDQLFTFDPVSEPAKWASNVLTQLAGPCALILIRHSCGEVVGALGCPLVLAAGSDRPSLMCAHVRWVASWGDTSSLPVAAKFASVGLAVVSLLRSLAALINVDQVLLGNQCFFTSADWPTSEMKLSALSAGTVWMPLVRLPTEPPPSDEPHILLVTVLPPAPK